MGLFSKHSTLRPRAAGSVHLLDVLGHKVAYLDELTTLHPLPRARPIPMSLYFGVIGLLLVREDAIRYGLPEVYRSVWKRRGGVLYTGRHAVYDSLSQSWDGVHTNTPRVERPRVQEIWVPA
jgi:hypothetical protein